MYPRHIFTFIYILPTRIRKFADKQEDDIANFVPFGNDLDETHSVTMQSPQNTSGEHCVQYRHGSSREQFIGPDAVVPTALQYGLCCADACSPWGKLIE